MSKRNDRVSSLIHREVAGLLQHKMRDPRLEALTITRVEVSNDLHYAWIYVDFVSRAGDMEKALAALAKASGFLRNELRQGLRMRYTPELVFRSDVGLEHSERIHNLLAELRDRGELPAEALPAVVGDDGGEDEARDQDDEAEDQDEDSDDDLEAAEADAGGGSQASSGQSAPAGEERDS